MEGLGLLRKLDARASQQERLEFLNRHGTEKAKKELRSKIHDGVWIKSEIIDLQDVELQKQR